jgi:CBS domain-containing protein
VVDNKDSRMLKGVITDRDIVIRCVADGHKPDCPVREHMTTGKLDTAGVDEDVHQVVARMEHDQIRRIPVVREDQRLAGVIAQADVALRLTSREPNMVSGLVEKVSEPGKTARP